MKQQELIDSFLQGATSGKALSLSIDGDQLVHYNTAIAERYGDHIILNYTRYSLATGRIQKMITETFDASLILYVSSVPSDTRSSLADYLAAEHLDDVSEPDDWIMRIRHSVFGEGFVISINNDTMKCLFGKQEKTLLYPHVVDTGAVEVIEDRS